MALKNRKFFLAADVFESGITTISGYRWESQINFSDVDNQILRMFLIGLTVDKYFGKELRGIYGKRNLHM